MVILGEVYTGLVRNSTAVPHDAAAQVLALVVGEPVRQTRRPMPASVSPTQLTGVDCQVTGRTGAATRVVGSVRSHAVLTGGRVLQGSAWLRLAPGHHGHRLPWAHYLARPGTAETLGGYDTDNLVSGFLAERAAADIDVGAIAKRTMDLANSSHVLDRRPAMKIGPVRIRWAATTNDAEDIALEFHTRTDDLRTVHFRLPETALDGLTEFCEILALHDWLLTAQQYLLDRYTTRTAEAADRDRPLRSAVELLHLWMPEARLHPKWIPLWEALDREAGMTPLWTTSKSRIRDEVSLALLTSAAGSTLPAKALLGGPR
jgi:hypothetical protein